jgi:hypothetical protein
MKPKANVGTGRPASLVRVVARPRGLSTRVGRIPPASMTQGEYALLILVIGSVGYRFCIARRDCDGIEER